MRNITWTIATSIGIIAFVSCQKKSTILEKQTLEKGYDPKKIEQAQQWLSEKLPYTKSETIWAAQWEDAFTQGQNNIETVEIPLSFKSERILLSTDCQEAFQESGQTKYLMNQTRLVVEYNHNSKLRRGFFMTVIPSKQYLEKVNFNLSENSYCYRDADFEGMVVYRDLNLNLLCGWVYKNGQTKEYIRPVYSFNATKGRGVSYDTFCQTEYIVHYVEWRYNNSSQVDYQYLYTEEYTTCWTSGGSGGGQHGELPPENGDGGGGESSGHPMTKLADIQYDEQSKSLQPAIERINSDCAGAKLLDGLGALRFQYDSTLPALSAYYPTSKTIKWYATELDQDIILHELMHAFQKQKGTSYQERSINIEVEAFLAQYAYCTVNNITPSWDTKDNLKNTFGKYMINPNEENYQLMVNYLYNLTDSNGKHLYDAATYPNKEVYQKTDAYNLLFDCYKINVQSN